MKYNFFKTEREYYSKREQMNVMDNVSLVAFVAIVVTLMAVVAFNVLKSCL